jgi:hypothetical protein
VFGGMFQTRRPRTPIIKDEQQSDKMEKMIKIMVSLTAKG